MPFLQAGTRRKEKPFAKVTEQVSRKEPGSDTALNKEWALRALWLALGPVAMDG